jgi:hypothetical protein
MLNAAQSPVALVARIMDLFIRVRLLNLQAVTVLRGSRALRLKEGLVLRGHEVLKLSAEEQYRDAERESSELEEGGRN